MPDIGDVVTATLTVDPFDGTTVATLTVTDPAGAVTTPSAGTADSGATWTAVVTYTAAGWWKLKWTVTGTGAGVEDQDVFVPIESTAGGPPAYASLEALKGRLKIELTDDTRDAALLGHLRSASRSIERDCGGRQFWLADTASARTFNPRGRVERRREGELLLVDDIGSLTDLTIESGDGTTFWPVPTSLFDTWPDNAVAKGNPIEGFLHVQQYGWSGASAVLSLVRVRIRITARWGFPSVPDQIGEATLITAHRLYIRKDAPEGVAGSSEWGVIRLTTLDPDVRHMIAPFRRPTFG